MKNYINIILIYLIAQINILAQNPNINGESIGANINTVDLRSQELRFSGDTFYLDRGIYYLNNYFNSSYTSEQLTSMSDTILMRISTLQVIDKANSRLYKTCSQVIYFNWIKNIPINENLYTPYTSAYKASSGRWDNCIHYFYDTGASGNCISQIICDLPDNDTYNWCSGSKYTKIFEDNFEGDKLNEDYWGYGYPWGREVDNSDKAWALKRNVEVSNGTLKLKTQAEAGLITDIDGSTFNGKSYTSSSIFSQLKYGYGKYEIKAKVPPSIGVNPAYWLNDGDLEIDGFEFFYMNRSDAPFMSVYSNKNNDSYPYACSGYSTTANVAPRKNRIAQSIAKKSHAGGGSTLMNTLPNLADGNWYIFSVVYDQNYITWWIETEDRQQHWLYTLPNVYQSGYALNNNNLNCSCTGCNVVVNPGFPDNFNGETVFLMGNGPTQSKDWVTGMDKQNGPPWGTVSTMEIDWVKIYVPDDCWNDATEGSGHFKSVDHFNSNHFTGNNVTLGGNGSSNPYEIKYVAWGTSGLSQDEWSPNTYCTTRANNELALLDGFSVQQDALFEGSISYHLGDNGSGVASDCNSPLQNDFWPQAYRKGSKNTVETKTSNSILQTKIYPNPTSNYIVVESEKEIQNLEFYNIYGQIVLKTNNPSEKINVSDFKDGVHFVKAFFENNTTITKFIKQN